VDADTVSRPAILTRTAGGDDLPCHQIHLSLGTSRLIQATVELKHDGKGIIWPAALAPYVVAVLPLKVDSEEHVQAANGIYRELAAAQIPVALDDRPLRPGQKFADADLVGYPRRVVIGDKSLKDNAVELQYRDGREARMISVEQAAGFLIKDLADTTL
jgi:prolyl-tRNA synthetase